MKFYHSLRAKMGINISQLYNADESGLFYRLIIFIKKTKLSRYTLQSIYGFFNIIKLFNTDAKFNNTGNDY